MRTSANNNNFYLRCHRCNYFIVIVAVSDDSLQLVGKLYKAVMRIYHTDRCGATIIIKRKVLLMIVFVILSSMNNNSK